MNIELRYLTGPRRGFQVHTRDEYLAFQARYLEQMRIKIPHFEGVPHATPSVLTVYINEGRLLVDCPCAGGVLVDAEWELACCTSCGAIYEANQLVFPSKADLLELDEHLGKRHTRNRNFDPRAGETMTGLKVTNMVASVTGGLQ